MGLRYSVLNKMVAARRRQSRRKTGSEAILLRQRIFLFVSGGANTAPTSLSLLLPVDGILLTGTYHPHPTPAFSPSFSFRRLLLVSLRGS